MTILGGLYVKLMSTSFVRFGNEKSSLVKVRHKEPSGSLQFQVKEKRNGFLRSLYHG